VVLLNLGRRNRQSVEQFIDEETLNSAMEELENKKKK